MRMGTGDDGQPLGRGGLLCPLPRVAVGGRRQRIQLSLVAAEGGPELSFVHWHAVRIQLGVVHRDMLDPPGPCSGQSDEALPDTGGKQSTMAAASTGGSQMSTFMAAKVLAPTGKLTATRPLASPDMRGMILNNVGDRDAEGPGSSASQRRTTDALENRWHPVGRSSSGTA